VDDGALENLAKVPINAPPPPPLTQSEPGKASRPSHYWATPTLLRPSKGSYWPSGSPPTAAQLQGYVPALMVAMVIASTRILRVGVCFWALSMAGTPWPAGRPRPIGGGGGACGSQWPGPQRARHH
jgi:hypothetical protein